MPNAEALREKEALETLENFIGQFSDQDPKARDLVLGILFDVIFNGPTTLGEYPLAASPEESAADAPETLPLPGSP